MSILGTNNKETTCKANGRCYDTTSQTNNDEVDKRCLELLITTSRGREFIATTIW
jgi:hypothetical protein